MPLKIEVVKKEKETVIVRPFGAIDSSSYEEFEQRIQPLLIPAIKNLILDMAGVDYISSMGVSAIIKTKKTLDANKASLLIINLQPQIKAVFEVIKALPNMRIFKGIEEADAYLDRIQRQKIEREPPKL